MSKFYEIDVEQKFRVIDRIVYIVKADSKEEALELVKEGKGDICHSEELERDGHEPYWYTAKIEEGEDE